MRVLSALIALLTIGMILIGFEKPDTIPFYLVPTGAVMAVVTWLSARNPFFIRSFAFAYAVVFALFAIGMVTFAYDVVPDYLASLKPKPFLMIAVTVFSCILYTIARLPLIRAIMGLSEPFFASSEPDVILPFGQVKIRMQEGSIGRLFMAVILGLTLIEVYMTILINEWYGRLFNALQDKNASAFATEIFVFLVLASIWIVLQIIHFLAGQYLLIRWRRWMSTNFFGRWMGGSTHYQMQFYGDKADNPDQRIAEDVRTFVVETYSISLSLFNKLLSLAAFVQVLWGLSATFKYQLGSFSLDSIPGYLVWVALVYAVLVTIVTHFIGRPLIRLNFNKERVEATFRFSLARIREYGEQIALLKGGKAETENLNQKYTNVVGATWTLVDRQKNLSIFTFAMDQLAVILPYVLLAPAYFSGATDLGSFTRTSSAFGQVQGGFTVFVDLYTKLASYKAALDRIIGFDSAMKDAKSRDGQSQYSQKIQPVSKSTFIKVQTTQLMLPTGKLIVSVQDLQLKAGERALLIGPSGSGKSTLFRAIAGIWPYWSGEMNFPEGTKVMLLPQRPYIPMGSLRSAVTYPGLTGSFEDDAIRDALAQVYLHHLSDKLDEEDQWAQRLSGGEQQRLAIARALLAQPDWLFLDEATASLDEKLEFNIYKSISEHLPSTTIVSIGHRSTLLALHDRIIEMVEGDGHIFTPEPVKVKVVQAV